MAKLRLSPILFIVLAACPVVDPAIDKDGHNKKIEKQSGSSRGEDEEPAPGAEVVQAPLSAERAPSADPRLAEPPSGTKLLDKTRSYFDGTGKKRIYIQV